MSNIIKTKPAIIVAMKTMMSILLTSCCHSSDYCRYHELESVVISSSMVCVWFLRGGCH